MSDAVQPGEQSIQAAVTAALDLSGFGAGGVAASSDLFALPAAKLGSSSASGGVPPPPYERLPADALAALKDALPTWREAGASRRRLAAAPLLEDVHKVGDRSCGCSGMPLCCPFLTVVVRADSDRDAGCSSSGRLATCAK